MNNQSSPDSIPFSQEAEEAVIGAVFVDPNAFLTVSEFLTAEDFYFLTTGYIWRAMEQLHRRKEPVDLVTVAGELEAATQLQNIGGYPYLTRLMADTPTSVHAEIYGRIVERHAIRRRLLQAADEIKTLAKDQQLSIDEVTTAAETRLFNVTDRQIKREFISLREALDEYFNQIEFLMNSPQGALGLPSGFRDLDVLLGGFQRSDLLIFAGRPGMGKCVTGETLIATRNGLLPIERLQPKDEAGIPDDDKTGTFYPLELDVQTPFGIQKTSHFYISDPMPTLKVKTRGSYFITGTHNHALLTLRPDGQKQWKTLKELQVGDKVAAQFYDPDLDDVVQLVEDYYSDEVKALVALPRLTGRPRFLWDDVISIQDAGEQVCYDLTVPEGHAFIANGLVNHNTSFLLSTAMNVARLGGRVAIFTMEMGAAQLTQRMVAMETGINTQRLRVGNVTNDEYARLVEAGKRINAFPIYIDDTPALSPMDMRTKCRRLQHEYGIDLIIVDYMQLMNAGGQYQNNRVQEISYISRALKELARELNVPLFSAAQLSRAVEQRQDKRPVLSDLRESGSIEQDSDIVMFLYRDVVYDKATEFPNKAEIIIAKHRNGPTGNISLFYNETITKFSDGVVRNHDLGGD